MKWSVDRSSTVRLAGTFGILACIAVLSYISLLKYKNTRQQIEHTQEAAQQIEEVLSTLKDAETGQRGYLLTGQESYLEPFHLALTQYKQQLDRLTDLTSDDLRQQQAVARLKPLVAEKLAVIKLTIALRRQRGYESAVSVVKTGRGKQIMDQIRTIVLAMKSEESHLLVERTQQSEIAVNQTIFAVIMGVFLANQELEQFAFIASHDLKEPLRTVRSFCSLLQSKHQDSLNEKGRDYLNRIQNATGRMQRLVDDLLSLSRITTQVKSSVAVNLAIWLS